MEMNGMRDWAAVLDHPVDPFICVGQFVDTKIWEATVGGISIVNVFQGWLVPVDVKRFSVLPLVKNF